jgi:transcriptional regulator with XRE-family HTH domain
MAKTHGTRSCYVAGCRRPECVRANAAYGSTRNRLAAYGRWQPRPLVDAAPAVAHLRWLSTCGVGWRTAARLAGVRAETVCRLLYPRGERPPGKRTHPDTAAAILAVQPDLWRLPDTARVDPTGTRRRLQALVALGWSQRRLAGLLGTTACGLGHLLRDYDRVTARRARAVRDLYDRLWNTPPPQAARLDRAAATRARRYAADRRWLGPGAWDDAEIDDPVARPVEGWLRRDRKRKPAWLAAEARELTRYGLSRQEAAERLGVLRNTLDQAMVRYPADDGEISSVA